MFVFFHKIWNCLFHWIFKNTIHSYKYYLFTSKTECYFVEHIYSCAFLLRNRWRTWWIYFLYRQQTVEKLLIKSYYIVLYLSTHSSHHSIFLYLRSAKLDSPNLVQLWKILRGETLRFSHFRILIFIYIRFRLIVLSSEIHIKWFASFAQSLNCYSS